MSTVGPNDAIHEIDVIRARQLQALRSAAPPRWYFLGVGIALVASSFGREVHIAPWGIVAVLFQLVALVVLVLVLHRYQRVTVTVGGRRCWPLLATWALGCGAVSAGGYLLALLVIWPYPATIGTAIFATLYAASGPQVMQRIYTATAA